MSANVFLERVDFGFYVCDEGRVVRVFLRVGESRGKIRKYLGS